MTEKLEYQMRIEVTFGPSELLKNPYDKRSYSHRVFKGPTWHGEGTVVYLMNKPPRLGKGRDAESVRLSTHMIVFAQRYFNLALADALKAMAEEGLPVSLEVVE